MTALEEKRIGRDSLLVWISAAMVAALGALVLFDALPGINWVIWTTSALIGLILVARRVGTNSRLTMATATLAVVIAGGAAVTAAEFMHFLIFISTVLLLAVSMLLLFERELKRVTGRFVVRAPFIAAGRALAESLQRATEASHLVRSPAARSVLRGLAITLPVLLLFSLLLAGADPVFARWRDEIVRMLETLQFLPRTLFFVFLLIIVLGAYGYAGRGPDFEQTAEAETSAAERKRWLGATERLMLLGSVAGLFWIFLAVQVSYLFGSQPQINGASISFAEYARRGFGELTVVATCSVLLIILAERYAEAGTREKLIRGITLAIVLAVMFLLASAFHRVALYEAAFGYTTARLYAQVYMLVVGATLLALAAEIHRGIDSGRVFRRSVTSAVIAFVVLAYWNHEGWIAGANIARFATTGKLDTVYLTRDLSPDAVPAIVESLPNLQEPARSQLTSALVLRYQGRATMKDYRWYEWNLRRARAASVLEQAGVFAQSNRTPVMVP